MSRMNATSVFDSISRHVLADVVPIVIDLEKSQGNRLVDVRDGRAYLDCISYIASNPLGHNHPKLFDSEFEKKLLRVARTKPSNSDFFSIEMAEFIETFARIAAPKSMEHYFFVEGGSVAVENAVKAAFDWKVRLNMKRGRGENRGSQILHFQEAFHGRTGYSLSLTNTDSRKTKYFPLFHWPRVPNPKALYPLSGDNLREVIAAEQNSLAAIEKAFQENGDDIAAIILEPIQGEGGDNHFRPEFHQALRKLADKHEALLIYDEVQSGFGLTGQMWAFQNYGVQPDIICFGKKFQVCGIIAGPRIDQIENNVFVEQSRLNSTWGGNLVDMVRSERYLQIVEEDQLVKNAREVGSYLQERLKALAEKHPNVFSNARGSGLMCAIDGATTEKRDKILSAAFREGLLLLKCGPRSLRFRPSLTFSRREVDEGMAILEAASAATVS